MLHAETIKVCLANLSDADRVFIRSFLALFSDPAQAEFLARVRARTLALYYHPGSGALHLIEVIESPETSAGDLLQFLSRFDETEWRILRTHAGGLLLRQARTDLSLAEQRARDILGFLPQPKTSGDLVAG